jgi:diguanylate cyclase (GGDEF)-like protein/PAS domain S-box-containing protein
VGLARSADRYWRSHLTISFLILIGEALAAVAYATMTHGVHREALFRIALVVAIAGGLGLALSSWVSTRKWRGHFVISCSVASVATLAVCGYLDGGLDSPFLFLSVLPIMYSALLLAPVGVAICSLASLATVVALGVSDTDIRQPQESILLFSATVIGAGLLAFSSALYRSRLESEGSRLIRRLDRLATTDALTGCANQGSFHKQLHAHVAQAARHGRPLSLLVCDVDLFKTYNDIHGHEQGDSALAAVGARLQSTSRLSDIVGRVGGDEFAILLPETDLASAATLAGRIVAACPTGEPTLSIGMAQLCTDALCTDAPNVSKLFEAADDAMYRAKAEGRNRFSACLPGSDRPSADWERAADGRRTDETIRQERRHWVETELVLGLLLEKAPVGFAFVDSDFRIMRLNPTFAEFGGASSTSGIGRTLAQATPRLWSRLGPHFRQVQHDGLAACSIEIEEPEADTDDVTTRLVDLYPVAVAGRRVGIGVVIVDITDRKRAEHAQEKLTDAVVGTLASAAGARDPYTAGHQRRVARMTGMIATSMGCDAWTVKGMTLAAAIHDIGKIAVPSEILTRPGRLSDAEMAVVRGHVRAGYDLISKVEFPWPVAEMVLQHHERLDGSGYPDALKDDEIGLGGRVLAVADVVEAMSAHRPYRPARGLEAALETILEAKGRLFDPHVVDACVALFREGHLTLEDGPWAESGVGPVVLG